MVEFEAWKVPVSLVSLVLLFEINLVVHLGLKYLFKDGNQTAQASHAYKSVKSEDEHLPPAKVDKDQEHAKQKSKRVDALEFKRESLLRLTTELCALGGILGYAWICENKPIFDHGTKEKSMDFFWFICLIILMVASGSLHHDPKSNDLVNREQTEEWKGWMQTVFLLYHYFSAASVYNSVRVMISCYVWMTGFGNFSFFYIKQDFGFVRFSQMMWRLNFTVVFLCLAMNNMYILYYICPLHTFYFLVVYATMRVQKHLNHSKVGGRWKLLIVGVIIFAVWEFGPIFRIAFSFLSNDKHPGAAVGAYGIQYEWHFRSALDHYSTYFGMIFAMNFPQATLWIAKVEKMPFREQVLIKGIVGLLLGSLFIWWSVAVLPLPKLEFNSMNPYTFMIPILVYIYFRNLTPWLRQRHLGTLAVIGKYTLETYLLQHHVWLTSNAKTLLVLVPNYPKINLAVVSAIYFLLAQRLYRITMVTRALLIPDNPIGAMVYLGNAGILFSLCGVLGWLCQLFGLSWISVLLGGCLVGYGAYLLVLRKIHSSPASSFSSSSSSSSSSSPSNPSQTSSALALTKFCVSVLMCTFVYVYLPLLMPTGAPQNTGPLRDRILYDYNTCSKAIFTGDWSSESFDDCPNTVVTSCEGRRWTWAEPDAVKQCKLKGFSSRQASTLLQTNNVLFIGDETAMDIAIGMRQLTKTQDRLEISKTLPQIKQDQRLNVAPYVAYRALFESPNLASAIAESTSGASVVVLGLWFRDVALAADYETYKKNFDLAAAHIKMQSNLMCAIVTPPSIQSGDLDPEYRQVITPEEVEKYRKALESSEISSVCKIKVPLDLLTVGMENDSLNGFRYGSETNMLVSQLLLNAISHEVSSSPASTVGSTKGKGSGGGVAESPFRGFIVLCIAAAMLYSMDSYGGIAFVVSQFITKGSNESKVSWEESVQSLHAKILGNIPR